MAPVAAGAAGLLHVLLEGGRRLQVQHVADVGLVDPEAEGARRHHDGASARPHEALLLPRALGARHSAVIALHRNAEACQHRVGLVHRPGGGAVHDSGTPQATRQPHQRAEPLVAIGEDGLEGEIRAMGRARDHHRIVHPEPAQDVLAHVRSRRRGERRHGRRAEAAQALAEAEVRGTEVVSPLRDAVRLVHRHQGDAARRECLGHLLAVEGLGRGHHQQRPAGAHTGERFAPRATTDRAVETHGSDVAREKLFVLVVQQREERRDQHHGARQQQRGHLVAGGLPEARREHDQHASARERGLDRALLLRMQACDAEPPGRSGHVGARRRRRGGLRQRRLGLSLRRDGSDGERRRAPAPPAPGAPPPGSCRPRTQAGSRGGVGRCVTSSPRSTSSSTWVPYAVKPSPTVLPWRKRAWMPSAITASL